MKPGDDLPALNVPELLRTYGLRPNKRLGQNFLVDPGALESVLQAAEIDGEASVLEIGPGLGSLTRLLARRARRVGGEAADDAELRPLADGLVRLDATDAELADGLRLQDGSRARAPRGGAATLEEGAWRQEHARTGMVADL